MSGDRAVLVMRVSTADQDPENQRARCEALAKANGLRVVQVLSAKESGRHDPKPRREALRMVATGKADAVVVWALDRWSRQGPRQVLADVGQIVSAGARMLSVQEPWVGQEGVGELLLAITAWVARQEAERTSRRTREGLERIQGEIARNGAFRARSSGKVRRRLGRPSAMPKEVVPFAAWYRGEMGLSWSAVCKQLKADGLGEYTRPTLQRLTGRYLLKNGAPSERPILPGKGEM